MTNPLVTVIMPSFNAADFIGEAVRSVLNQTCANFELLVIDDGSTDGTARVIDAFVNQDLRVKYFSLRQNTGRPAIVRNHGIRQARGEFIAFLDADDIWAADKLRIQVEGLESDPAAGLIFCPFFFKNDDDTGKKVFRPKDREVSGYIYDKLINSNFIVASSVMVRASALTQIGDFDEAEELRFAEDFDLWLRIAREYKVRFIPEVLGTYQLHASNSNVSEQRLQKALAVIDKHRREGWLTGAKTKRAQANFYFREGWGLLGQNSCRAKACSCFGKAIALNRGSFKIFFVSFIGLIFSQIPAVYNFIKSRHWDRKIGCFFINPQNL